MRIFLLFLVLAGGGLAYVHSQQPKMWNQFLALLQVSPQRDDAASKPTFISPGTTNFTSSHVHWVEQPEPAAAPPSKKVFVPPATLPAQPHWVWQSTDGKHVYRDVIVSQVEADRVIILDDDGGAAVDIATLPQEIQQQLNYDPELAAAAAAGRKAKP